jgi:hypothetical protein
MVAVVLTVTLRELGAKPVAVAVMFVVPTDTAVICGLVDGMIAPAGMKTLGVTVAAEGLALVRLTVRPPVGAGAPKVRGRLWVPPRVMVGIVPRLISEEVAVTEVDAVTKPLALALRVLAPLATPV